MNYNPPQVFLAHSARDKKFVRRLAFDLRHNSVSVWLDEAQMAPGDSLYKCLSLGLTTSDYVCAVLSPDSVNSEWVTREVAASQSLEIEKKKVYLVPLLYRRCDIPTFLKDRIYVDITHPSKYKRGFAALLRRFIGDTMPFKVVGKGGWFDTLDVQDGKWRLPTWQEVSALSHRLPAGLDAVWTCSEHAQGVYVFDMRTASPLKAGGVLDMFIQIDQVLVRREGWLRDDFTARRARPDDKIELSSSVDDEERAA